MHRNLACPLDGKSKPSRLMEPQKAVSLLTGECEPVRPTRVSAC